jgi:hypothetical protein
MFVRSTLVLSAILGAVHVAGSARAADGATPVPAPAPAPKPKAPPKYENLRFREDWSVFRCTPVFDRCDLADRMKASSVASDGNVWLDVGGQVRGRYEAWKDQTVGAVRGDDSWWLARLRAHADLHLGCGFHLFAEGIYADADGRDAGPRPVDENHGDFLNLFAEGRGTVGCDVAGVWVGRDELLFGKQRLVGPLDWANTRRTFDGAGGWIRGCTWRLDAFYVQPVLVEPDEGDEADDNTDFAGVHYLNTAGGDRVWEAYALYLHRDVATWAKVADEETRWTVGGTCRGPIGWTRFDYETEVSAQFGEFGRDSIAAGQATVEFGWKPCACWEPRIALGADWASGDTDGPGGDVGTFNQLFPTGHLWFGWADLIGRQNVVAGRLTVTAKPTPKLFLRADLHAFWRASTDDGVFTAGGGVLRPAGGADARAVGTEVDLQAKYTIDRHLELEAGWGHFMPGAFLNDTGAHEDTDFVYAMATFTF